MTQQVDDFEGTTLGRHEFIPSYTVFEHIPGCFWNPR